MASDTNPRTKAQFVPGAGSVPIYCALFTLFLSACGGSGGGGRAVDPANIDPALFVSGITNRLLPLTPGTTSIYEGEVADGHERVETAVTSDQKTILGVPVTVVHDRGFVDGQLAEDTFDWYAEDVFGNVWYFGEDTKELENGQVVSTEGTWEAGVNGAEPGIVMQAHPQAGQVYLQEKAIDVAEDLAEVLATDVSVQVPFGSFSGCIQTKETTRLKPGSVEHKFHCPDVGLVKSVNVEGGSDQSALTDIQG